MTKQATTQTKIERTILSTAAVVSGLLLFASIDNFLASRRFAEFAVIGQVERELFGPLRNECRPPRVLRGAAPAEMNEPTPEETTRCLTEFFQRKSRDGLRYLAVANSESFSGIKSAPFYFEEGERRSPYEQDLDKRMRGRPVPLGDLVYFAMPPGTENTQVPTMIFEYEPTRANSLLLTGWITLFSGFVGVFITLFGSYSLIRVARQRESANQRAREKEKLAAVGQMSAVMAHEIRNPLAAAKGNTQLLAEMLEPGTRAQRKALQTVDELVRVEHLTNDLLDFIRSGKVNRADVDPVLVIQSAIDSLQTTTPIFIDSTKAPGAWSLDRLAIERVFCNLLRNSTQAQPESYPIDITVFQQEQQLVITVRDRGPGFPPGVDVLTPFITTKPNGNGLGLPITEQIIKAHQGSISLNNHPEGGALVTITI